MKDQSRLTLFKQNTQNHSKLYFAMLGLISLAVLVIYYCYLKDYGGLYFTHYYEYYTRQVLLADSLLKLKFPQALGLYLNNYVDKILVLRNVPFLMLFGYSHFIFFYAGVCLNLLLLLLLFQTLLKIMHPEKAFYFTLLILGQYFFIELLAAYYVDLHFFLACSIFFVYLSLFERNPQQYNLRMTFLVLLLFLTKNVAYPLLPVLSLALFIYFLVFKRNPKVYILRLSLILAVGFLFYYLLALGGIYQLLVRDLHAATSTLTTLGRKLNLIEIIIRVFQSFDLHRNIYFFDKFPVPWLNFILYPLVLFVAFRKRDFFWLFLFLAGEVFFIFFFNIKGHHHDYRYFLPFYFVYLYFAYEFIIILIREDFFGKWLNLILVLVFLILAVTGFTRLLNPNRPRLYAGTSSPKLAYNFAEFVPPGAKVYVPDGDEYFHISARSLDLSPKDYTYLAKADPRFRYKIVSDISKADYAAEMESSTQIHPPDWKLIAAGDGYRLFKIR